MDQLENLSPETLEAMDLTQQAHLLASKDEYDDALDLLGKAQEADPMYVGAYIEEGNIYTVQGELDQAGSCYEKAMQIDKNSGELHYSMGNRKLLLNEYQEAIREFRPLVAKVILVSDFYLGKKYMSLMLSNHGIKDLFDELYISCDYHKSKRFGTIYDEVKKNTLGAVLIMIG